MIKAAVNVTGTMVHDGCWLLPPEDKEKYNKEIIKVCLDLQPQMNA